MTKDAEKLLKFILDKAKKENVDEVSFDLEEVNGIPNIDISIKSLCEEMKSAGVISMYSMSITLHTKVYLTSTGLEYFDEQEEMRRMMKDKNVTFNVSGQMNLASGNATINATQNNGVSVDELNEIIKGIMGNLSGLKKEDADELVDTVEMVQEEFAKPEPRVSRLKKCITLISSVMSIANGIPDLTNNLHKLVDYIQLHIH